MTKKHYVAVAHILRIRLDEMRTSYKTLSAQDARSGLASRQYGYCEACESVAHALADYFQTENKQFDRARFLNACGIEVTK